MPGKEIEFSCEKSSEEQPEHLLRALNSLQTSEEKLAALCKKYTDLHDEHRQLQTKFKQSQRKLAVIMREKDQLQTEHSKAVLAKSKLESLCRELQRHNKLVKEESLARAKEEEEKRKEVTSKFQETINDIQSQMNEHYAKNTKLREENIELANKLKNLIEQYELREMHIEKVFKHKELEQQLVDAKLAQANLQMSEEKEKNLQEKQLLLTESAENQNKIEMLEAQEKQLRAQVALYTEKYEEFQQTLAKSNEVFQSFKSEMEKMTKKIKKLEKETMMWKTRWENSNKALLEMAEEKTRSDREKATMQSKIQKLEKLCRALQEERRKNTQKDTPENETKSSSEEPEEKTTTTNATPAGEVQDITPTKTPPNTPEGQSRGSPVTTQDGERNATPDPAQVEKKLEEASSMQDLSNDAPAEQSNEDGVDPSPTASSDLDGKPSRSDEAVGGEAETVDNSAETVEVAEMNGEAAENGEATENGDTAETESCSEGTQDDPPAQPVSSTSIEAID